MIYKSFQDINLSALGMGCMRLPVTEDGKTIDKDATRQMIAYAMEQGINYYDTAWGYHDGQSELVIGEILKDYPRESFYLATKFPGYDVNNMKNAAEIFEKQLEKCQTDYFDFYLCHCVSESNINFYLDPQYGLYDYLMEQKRNGRIRHLGFSAHASLETMKRFLDAYGEGMEFCMIQLNWFDWSFQNAEAKVQLIKRYGLPVWVMEPVRGGSLVALESQHEDKLKAMRPDTSVPEWCFRFVQSIPEVVMTLSGMSNFEQLKENIETYKEAKPLDETERQVLLDIAREMIAKNKLPCTKCNYCTTYCPKKLDIPAIIEVYNKHIGTDDEGIDVEELEAIEQNKRPTSCVGCKACEVVCPQNIKISHMMADFVAKVK